LWSWLEREQPQITPSATYPIMIPVTQFTSMSLGVLFYRTKSD
jgi:hypothetical protein